MLGALRILSAAIALSPLSLLDPASALARPSTIPLEDLATSDDPFRIDGRTWRDQSLPPPEWLTSIRLGAQTVVGGESSGWGGVLEIETPTHRLARVGGVDVWLGFTLALAPNIGERSFGDAGVRLDLVFLRTPDLELGAGGRLMVEAVSPGRLLGDGTEAGLAGGGFVHLDWRFAGGRPSFVFDEQACALFEGEGFVNCLEDDAPEAGGRIARSPQLALTFQLDYVGSHDPALRHRVGGTAGVRVEW